MSIRPVLRGLISAAGWLATPELTAPAGSAGPAAEKQHIVAGAFGAAAVSTKEHYREWFSPGMAKLYEQTQTVGRKPNPPREGRFWVCNDRPEGYADYRVGRFYLGVDDVSIEGRVVRPWLGGLFVPSIHLRSWCACAVTGSLRRGAGGRCRWMQRSWGSAGETSGSESCS